MLLDSIIESIQLDPGLRETLLIVLQQLNMLLCIVNSVIDLKMIEADKFQCLGEEFSPLDTFRFVISMF